MDFKGGSSRDLVATIQGVAKNWRAFSNRDPSYAKGLKERRKEQGKSAQNRLQEERVSPERPYDEHENRSRRSGFEVTV
jgi:hypothetical protein